MLLFRFPKICNLKRLHSSGSPTQQSRPAPVDSGQDQAQLSVDNETIQQLKANLSQVPEVRQERVDALRQAVSNGSYQSFGSAIE